jgi:hypothetical protein
MKTIIAEEKKRATSEEVFVYKKIAEKLDRHGVSIAGMCPIMDSNFILLHHHR